MAYDQNNTRTYVSRSGHITQECDAEDDAYMLLKHKDGHHIFLDSDGSVQIAAVKVPADNKNGGKLKISVWGDAMVKVRQNADIEVLGDTKLECNGDIDAHAVGDLKLGAEGNIKIQSSKNVEIHANQAIGLGAKAKISIDTPRIEENTDMKKSTVSGPVTDEINGERTLSMTDPRGTFWITSKGHMINTIAGDQLTTIGGRDSYSVGGKIPVPPLPALAGQTAAYQSIIGMMGGTGRSEKVMIGNDVTTVTVGNKITNVAAGNVVNTAGAGTITMAAGVNATITASANVTIAGATVFLN
jgi:hypothetical protein|tara:strand:+ start:842 stop:1741 length:900 start_codon:yes stop_codon:yes gene_type:complete